MSRRRVAELGLLYCALVWGSTFYMVKGLLDTVDPVLLVAYRFLIAAALLIPWMLGRKLRLMELRQSAVLGLLLAIEYHTQTIGLQFTSASSSGFITGLFVVFVPLLGLVLFRQVPSIAQWLSCTIAVVGLWMLTGSLSTPNIGDMLTVACAITYAGHIIANDRVLRDGGEPIVLTFHSFWINGVASLALASLTGRPIVLPPTAAFGLIAFLAVVPTLSAFFIVLLAQRHVAPARASLLLLLEPVFAAVFAWTLGNERFRPEAAFGGALIVVAMAIGELSRTKIAVAAEGGVVIQSTD